MNPTMTTACVSCSGQSPTYDSFPFLHSTANQYTNYVTTYTHFLFRSAGGGFIYPDSDTLQSLFGTSPNLHLAPVYSSRLRQRTQKVTDSRPDSLVPSFRETSELLELTAITRHAPVQRVGEVQHAVATR